MESDELQKNERLALKNLFNSFKGVALLKIFLRTTCCARSNISSAKVHPRALLQKIQDKSQFIFVSCSSDPCLSWVLCYKKRFDMSKKTGFQLPNRYRDSPTYLVCSTIVGSELGINEGNLEGCLVGTLEGTSEGMSVGKSDGTMQIE